MARARVLVVEDDADLRLGLVLRLRGRGYDVLESADGAEGLSLARMETPDLILLDLMLPNVDGYRICRMLKFDDRYMHIPVIIFSARTLPGDKARALEVGANAFFTKPFEFSDLAERIDALLANGEHLR